MTCRVVRPLALLVLLVLLAPCAELDAQPRSDADRYDDVFRKATKRHFGPAFDWRLFKAQGMAESNIDAAARSHVGARGVMQLMPGTFREVASKNPELTRIDDAASNIMAGVAYDRRLWEAWARDSVETDRLPFTLASYNAGRGTLLAAQRTARTSSLDPRTWANIERVAPTVPRWRHAETLGYVRRIAQLHVQLDDRGRLMNGTSSARGRRAR